MKKATFINISVIVGTILIAVSLLTDSMVFYAFSNEKERAALLADNPDIHKSIINLGLDIQGGSRLVLEVDTTGFSEERKEKVFEKTSMIIENRVNRLGVSEASVRKQGVNRLIVEVPGLKDPQRAKNIIRPHGRLAFRLVEEPKLYRKAIRVIDSVITRNGPVEESATMAPPGILKPATTPYKQ